MSIEPTLFAVFLTGLLGGVHCAGMCGGIVGALGLLGRANDAGNAGGEAGFNGAHGSVPLHFVPSPTGGIGAADAGAPRVAHHRLAARRGATSRPLGARLAPLLPYNLGRLSTYTLLGASAGAAGSFGWLLGEALPVQQLAFALTNVLLVVMGLYVAGWRRIAAVVEGAGGVLWRHVRPLATASLRRAGSTAGGVIAGALWGLVPCGMVYAVLAGALLSGSATNGAALMLAFGLGTLPNLLLLGLGGGAIARFARAPGARRAAGASIAAFGVLGLLRLEVAERIPILRELCVHLPAVGA